MCQKDLLNSETVAVYVLRASDVRENGSDMRKTVVVVVVIFDVCVVFVILVVKISILLVSP